MKAGGPRSVAKIVDPTSREMAEDLARREGISLQEWLSKVAAEGPEDATSQDYFVQGAAGARLGPADDPRRVTDALERLSPEKRTLLLQRLRPRNAK